MRRRQARSAPLNERVVAGAPQFVRQPFVVLIRHQRRSFHDLLGNRKKEARPILRNLRDRIGTTMLPVSHCPWMAAGRPTEKRAAVPERAANPSYERPSSPDSPRHRPDGYTSAVSCGVRRNQRNAGIIRGRGQSFRSRGDGRLLQTHRFPVFVRKFPVIQNIFPVVLSRELRQ